MSLKRSRCYSGVRVSVSGHNDALAIPGIGFLGISITGQSNLGTATDYPRTNPSENRFQFVDTLTWTHGRHSIKFGVDIQRTEDYTNLLFNRTGAYLYPSFSALAADFSGNTVGAKNWSQFTQTIGNPVVDFTIPEYAFFIQDYFKVTPKLTFNLGVRYDYADLPQPSLSNPDYPATGRIATYGKEIAPRLGVAYALDQQSKTVIRAGWGMFYGRYPGGMINSLFLGNGLYQKSITLNGSNAADKASGPVFPNVLPNSNAFNPPAGSVNLTMAGEDFRAPYTEQGDIAIERQLAKTMALTVSYLWSRGLHLTGVQDINIGAPVCCTTYRINDASGNQAGTYTTPVFVRQNRLDPRYSRVNIVQPALNSWYNGLAVQLNKRMANGIVGTASYTWSHAIDEGQGSAGTPNIFASGGPQSYLPGDYRGEKGSSALDVRHRLVVSMVWQPTFTKSTGAFARYVLNSWQLSLLGTAQSSPPSTPVVSISSAPVPAGYTVAFSGSSLNGYTTGGFGNRVPFEPISSVQLDPAYRLDARLAKVFPFTDRFRAMFTFDAFNVFNHTYFTSVQRREYTLATVAGTPTLSPASGFGVGTATQGFPDGTNARRLQVGVRLLW